MSYVRSDGYRLKDPQDDEAYQVTVGDLQRLALNLARGSVNSAYGLTPTAAGNIGASATTYLAPENNLGDVLNRITSAYNLGVLKYGGYTTSVNYSAGSGTHTFTSGKVFFIAVIQAGGGGNSDTSGSQGGGLDCYGSNCGGSGGGAFVFGRIASPSASYTIGAGGTNGASATGGSNTTFTLNATTITAAGGGAAVTNGAGSGSGPGAAGWCTASNPGNADMLWIPLSGQNGQAAAVARHHASASIYFWNDPYAYTRPPTMILNTVSGLLAGSGFGVSGAIEIYEL